ncbi:MAG: hypothetical protein U5J64_12565 [Halobacteriales archaeon]|nr:hypothetical protein [Halobacteriales archaeon]
MTVLIAVGVVAVCGAVGILGYFTHRFIYLLQTEVNCMKRVVARRRRKVERINREIGAEE